LVLQPDGMAAFEKTDSSWVMHNSISLPALHSPPRDLRGRIHLFGVQRTSPSGEISGTREMEVFLAGISCRGSWYPTLTLECQGDSSLAANLPEEHGPKTADKTSQAYSAISNSSNGHTRWIETRSDGNAQLFDNSPEAAVATFPGWGDDAVSITTKCSTAWQVLATGSGDWTSPDHIQLYEIQDKQSVAVGRPLEISGPVLMLRESDDGESTRVVWRDLQTGMYEASTIAVSCGD
jgi:hypothetical protein